MVEPSSSIKPRPPSFRTMEAYLDCLTDGSEYTGGPAIFLTLRKSISNPDSILARYNLTGLPSLTSRLSSDQSFQLLSGGCFRCILLPTLDNVGGLLAVFLNLAHYGYKTINPTTSESCNDSESSVANATSTSMLYGDVTIIGPHSTSSLVDGILDVLFGNARKRPSIRVCEVPNQVGCWWDVYQDSYVRIWAQSVEVDSDCDIDRKRKRVGSSCDSAKYNSIVYIVMIKSCHQATGCDNNKLEPLSFAILPHVDRHEDGSEPTNCSNVEPSIWNVLRNLPQEIVDLAHDKLTYLDFILHRAPASEYESADKVACIHHTEALESSNGRDKMKKFVIRLPRWLIESRQSLYHLSTLPHRRSGFDPGILIRAQQRSQLLNQHLPFAFPLNACSKGRIAETNSTADDESKAMSVHSCQLKSCCSVRLNGARNVLHAHPFAFLSRTESILSRCTSGNGEGKSKLLDSEVLSLLEHTYKCGVENVTVAAAKDGNEIDLDNSSESDDEIHSTPVSQAISFSKSRETSPYPAVPHLLLLGTGCATPSPLRSSSSYALFMPTSIHPSNDKTKPCRDVLVLSAIIECGEGTLTSLSRHLLCNNDVPLSLEEHLRWVKFIWISHSHLDHYGDIASVVHAISVSKKKAMTSDRVVVIAPSKVLRLLSVVLGSTNRGAWQSSYVGITQREFQASPFASHIRSMIFDYALAIPSRFVTETNGTTGSGEGDRFYRPFASIRNVEVEHCKEAFALIIELRLPKGTDQFLLCFSGDTRPSENLVKECRSCPLQLNTAPWQQASMPPPPPPRISLLLHEATFLHDEHGRNDAVKKRHSTTIEALDVAKRMQAEACLLTHFSQRYKHVSISDACAVSGKLEDSLNEMEDGYSFHWGIGIDGMLVPLTKQAMSSLRQLSGCVDHLLSSGENDKVLPQSS
jgi:ribonuclease BN (tRNA processing enzyme)